MKRLALSLLLLLLTSSPAGAYKLLGSAWDADRGPVLFHLEPSGSDDIDDGSDLDAVRSAFRRWSCVAGSRLRLLEGEAVGAKENEAGDGRNSVFWDEDGSYGLGVATLGVTFGPAGESPEEPVERTWSTIVFNGVDHTWSTSDNPSLPAGLTDVESIAVHEAGHWLGLAHPCEDAQETVCLGPDEAVMAPTYPGGLLRELGSDDEEGIRALYPQDDDSTCQGPFRQGERCSCNDECVEGLLCVPTSDGGLCAPACSSEDASCPAGFSCVLGAGSDGAVGGLCQKLEGEGAAPGSICQRDDECALGLCARAAPVGRTVCRVSCEAAGDCPAEHACVEGVCLSTAGNEGLVCEDLDEGGCACSSGSDEPGAPTSGLLLLLLLSLALCLRATLARAGGALVRADRQRETPRHRQRATPSWPGVAYRRLRERDDANPAAPPLSSPAADRSQSPS